MPSAAIPGADAVTDVSSPALMLDLGDRSYAIHVGEGILSDAAALIPFDLSRHAVFVVADKNVAPHLAVLKKALASARSLHVMEIEGGEKAKSWPYLEKISAWLLQSGVDRHSVFIALGGGVIGDLGGFAASIAMRGIPYVQIPTTLLAQVDSSVGGKTGINTDEGKNLIGSFYQPRAVICDAATLKTLPERELKAGYAEIVKYGLINDPAFFEWLEANGKKVIALDPAALSYAVRTSCAAKAAIVGQDERESGSRALLNLGHTFAHALEAAAAFDGRLLHGEAVSIGMVLAHRLSVKMGLCSGQDAVRIENHLKSCGLKTELRDIAPALRQSAAEIADLMKHDKKSVSGTITFILSRGIGKAFTSTAVSMDDVRTVIGESM